MAGIDQLVEDLERSYTEIQERMSDPAVYNDRREAAEVGRRLKELEEPHRLARQWREARADVEAAGRATGRPRSASRSAGPTGCSACPGPSRRAASTPRRRRSR